VSVEQCSWSTCYYCRRDLICAATLSRKKTVAFRRGQLTCGPCSLRYPIWKEGDLLHNTLRWIIRKYKTGGQDRRTKKRAARHP
jgi:hypothetical protein